MDHVCHACSMVGVKLNQEIDVFWQPDLRVNFNQENINFVTLWNPKLTVSPFIRIDQSSLTLKVSVCLKLQLNYLQTSYSAQQSNHNNGVRREQTKWPR